MKPATTTPVAPATDERNQAPPLHLVRLTAALIAADLLGQPKADDQDLVALRLVEFVARASTHPRCPLPVSDIEAAEREHLGCVYCGTGIYATHTATAIGPN